MENYDFGNMINDGLKKKKMKQTELAKLLDIDKQSVNRWCRGRAIPDINTFFKIAFLLDLSLDKIVRPENSLLNKSKLIEIYESIISDAHRDIAVQMLALYVNALNKPK